LLPGGTTCTFTPSGTVTVTSCPAFVVSVSPVALVDFTVPACRSVAAACARAITPCVKTTVNTTTPHRLIASAAALHTFVTFIVRISFGLILYRLRSFAARSRR
jgi:hypothetical protein